MNFKSDEAIKEFLIYIDHQNYLGIDEKFGPIAVSIKREKLDDHTSLLRNEADSSHGTRYQYRVIVRTSEVSWKMLIIELRGTVIYNLMIVGFAVFEFLEGSLFFITPVELWFLQRQVS